jgi:tRNA pseudouridine-54 N-methylase
VSGQGSIRGELNPEIAFAIRPPEDVVIHAIVIRPTAQERLVHFAGTMSKRMHPTHRSEFSILQTHCNERLFQCQKFSPPSPAQHF